jgi:hypothetical protein
MPSRLYPISETEWLELTVGLPETKLRPEEREAVRRSNELIEAGHEFLLTGERREHPCMCRVCRGE